MTAIINPGLPDRNSQEIFPENSNLLSKRPSDFCEKCKIIKNSLLKTYPCEDCDVCVEGYDHHCPWTGKCIGRNNACYFYTFIISIFVMLFYFMVISIVCMP